MTTQFQPGILNCPTFQHLLAVGKLGTAQGEFRYPEGVSIQEDTGHIYVADCNNNRVQIFSETGKLLNQFGDQHLTIPWGVLIHEDSVYVTDNYCHAILQFAISEFTMIKRVGREGSGHKELKSPHQLAISPNQHLFVADYGNHRLQILNLNLDFLFSIRHQSMTDPVDVKFSTNQMLVLSRSDNPCVHIFTFSGEKIGSIITRGIGLQVREAYFFCLDRYDNIMMSDRKAHCIKIFSLEGELLHTLSEFGLEAGMLYYPNGIAMLRHTHIVCVSENINFSLQIFSD